MTQRYVWTARDALLVSGPTADTLPLLAQPPTARRHVVEPLEIVRRLTA